MDRFIGVLGGGREGGGEFRWLREGAAGRTGEHKQEAAPGRMTEAPAEPIPMRRNMVKTSHKPGLFLVWSVSKQRHCI